MLRLFVRIRQVAGSRQAGAKMKNLKSLLDECEELATTGNGLAREEAEALEKALNVSSTEWVNRIKLIGFYFTRYHSAPDLRVRRQSHICWFIHHYPTHPFCSTPYCTVIRTLEPEFYKQVKQYWMEQIEAHPTCSDILLNAACANIVFEPAEAKALVFRAQTLEPNSEFLAHVMQRMQSREKY